MRNMAFSITTEQMYAKTKTVTRRLGWSFLKPGDIVMAVEKGMGLKKGEKIKKIYPIEIVSVRGEYLSSITIEDVAREGFPQMNVPQFVRMFAKSHSCDVNEVVNRIEFKPLAEPNNASTRTSGDTPASEESSPL
jgi:hypothetical protein